MLGVMVFGGPYMGMEEFRRRTRYAVLAGLNGHGDSPDDPEHIGYVKSQKWGGPYLPDMVVPFEWLTRENGGQVWTLAHDRAHPLPIVRVTSTDDKLIGAVPEADTEETGSGLLEELRLRCLLDDGLVALVGQWDTAYSRNLIDLLEQGLGEERGITAYYPRGLDEELPARNGNGNDAKGKADREKSAQDKIRKVERPEGDAQTDYLRRLILELKLWERDATDRGRNKVRAVGILGDDYHDKLLVLKALQHAFPDAVFITTDLDAAMLHPGDNRHTRNLVVASSFGLRLSTRREGSREQVDSGLGGRKKKSLSLGICFPHGLRFLLRPPAGPLLYHLPPQSLAPLDRQCLQPIGTVDTAIRQSNQTQHLFHQFRMGSQTFFQALRWLRRGTPFAYSHFESHPLCATSLRSLFVGPRLPKK